MSTISEKVRVALYAKLNVSTVLSSGTGLATGVHNAKAPETASLPYAIFAYQAPGSVLRVFGQTLALEDGLWLIKGVADEDCSTTKEPQAVAAEIANACEAAIGTSLTLTGNTVALIERVQDIPPYVEKLSDRFIYHAGFLLRVAVE